MTLSLGKWRFTSRVGCSLLIVAPVVGRLASSAYADDLLPDIETGTLQIDVEFVGDFGGVRRGVTGIGHAGDGSGRLFFSERGGNLIIIDNGTVLPDPFLDLSDSVLITPGTPGLLGFAFHPDYADAKANGFGKVYTYHSEPADTAPADFPRTEEVSSQNVITEWQVSQADPDLIDVSSCREIYRADHIAHNHGGGMLAFGLDGYLYTMIGTPSVVWRDAQSLDNIYGKMLRIDPIDPALTVGSPDAISANGMYRIPADNPFVAEPGAVGEIYAIGLRHPWRFSIDRLTGTPFAGDVGPSDIEEVDAVQAGGNFGWPYLQGTFSGPREPPDPPPTMIDPMAQYDHDDGAAVIGGYVYRGSAIPSLQGKYVFGDLTTSSHSHYGESGRLFWIDPFDEFDQLRDPSEVEIKEFLIGEDEDEDPEIAITTFGEDESGELYYAGVGPDTNDTTVMKIVASIDCPWDCDGSDDEIVGIDDFLAVLVQWSQNGTSCDFGAGAPGVGVHEFLAVLSAWGECP